MIHTGLSPNTERDDLLLTLKVLFTPWTWKRHAARKKLENLLSEKLSVTSSGSQNSSQRNFLVSTVDSGRTALFTILKAMGIGDGDEVILQAYTCVAVPDPILWAEATPVYVDCEDDLTMSLEDLKNKVTEQTRAIVVQHTFGQPARIKEILEFAREKKIAVIEDCAHALGGEISSERVGKNGGTHDMQPLGSFADASFFSFGRDKSISSVFGGAIATSSPELHQKISALVAAYPLPSLIWIKQQLMHPLVLAAAKVTYNFPSFGKSSARITLGKIILEIAKRLHIISKAVQSTELSGGKPTFFGHQFSGALAQLAYHQLQKLPRFTAHRQEIAQQYSAALSGRSDINAPAFIPGHAYLRYTVVISENNLNVQNVESYFLKARAKGIQLGDWYTTVIAPRGVQYEKIGYEMGSCPNAERLASTTFNLPTHIGINHKAASEIIKILFG